MWSKKLDKFPLENYKEECINNYRDNFETSGKPYVHGYRLFKCKRVAKAVTCYSVMGNRSYVKASVGASQRNTSYAVLVQFDGNGAIIEAECECIGGKQGKCKHVFALLWMVLDCVREDSIFLEEDTASTSGERSWGTGTKNRHVDEPFDNLQFIKHHPLKQHKNTVGILEKKNKTRELYDSVEISADLLKTCHELFLSNGLNMLAETISQNNFKANAVPSSSKETGTSTCQKKPAYRLPITVLWVTEYERNCQRLPFDHTFGDILQYCELSLQEAHELESKTREQSKSLLWEMERTKRITSSKFGEIINRVAEVNGVFINRVFSKSNFQSAYMKLGLDNEQNALKKYLQLNPKCIQLPCGLCVNPGIPFLAATPDSIIYNQDTHDYHLIEIKTVSKAFETGLTVVQCIQNKSIQFLKLESENIVLKKGHKFYMQIQGQLAITGLDRCDLIVDTGGPLHIMKVDFDRDLWISNYLPKLLEFYFRYYPVHIYKPVAD